jgi:hypothetical protein
MTLLGDQADEMHRISYIFQLNPAIVARWAYRGYDGYDALLKPI